jgi:transposase
VETTQAIRDYDKQIENMATTKYPKICLLKQIKGVGTLIALTYMRLGSKR